MAFSFRTHLLLIISAMIIVLTSVLTYLSGNEASDRAKERIGLFLSEVSFQMGERMDYFMWDRTAEINYLGENETFRRGDPELVRKELDHMKKLFPFYSWMGFTDPAGKVVASTDGLLQGADISARPVYKNALVQPFVGDVHEAVLLAKLLPSPTGEPMQFVDVSTPVKDKEGKFLGVLAAHLSWEWSKNMEESILQPLARKVDQANIFVISGDHTVLLGPKDMLGTKLDLESLHLAKANEGGGWKLEKWPDGQQYVTGYSYADGYADYAGLNWTILVRQPLDAAYGPVKDLRVKIVMIGLFFGVLFFLAGIMFSNRVTAPIRRLTRTFDQIHEGAAFDLPEHRGIREVEYLTDSIRRLLTDLDQSERSLTLMKEKANRDNLTGLPNRMALEAYMERTCALLAERGGSLAVLYLDLDGFKNVNDTLGHQLGDQLLRQVGSRISGIVRDGDLVSRLGGDEFVLVLMLGSTDGERESRYVADRVVAALNDPFYLEGNPVRIGCSIGIALWEDGDPHFQSTIRSADEAMYASKRAGKNRVTFYGSKG